LFFQITQRFAATVTRVGRYLFYAYPLMQKDSLSSAPQ
jgi:hypothetical protein